jgi:ADP-dependent NAD(P)H-hydrate dehydratase / NAD(P)H-hydrate epimerase
VRSAHSVEQVRAAEKALMSRVPLGTLMQRAAYGLATAVADLLDGTYGARVLLLVGSGDNGGDALHAGAQLARRGAKVEAVLLGSRTHEGGLAELRARGGRVVTLEAARTPDVVVDGIVGIGGKPGLRPDAEAAVTRFPGAAVVAVDVP